MHLLKLTSKIAPSLALGVMLACGGGSSPKEASAQQDQAQTDAAGGEAQLAQAGSEQAPDFQVQTLDGEQVSLESYEGQVLIIDFWATWCPPCVKGIPHFVELYETYNDQGLEMLGVSVDRGGPGVVEKFVQKHDVNYDIAMANMEVIDAYQVYSGIPTAFIIDRSGKVVEKVVGYRPKDFFESRIKDLL